MMDTNKLRTFIETVQIGSINKAAEKLGYTQSGLTYTLNKLEEELGVKLLIRMHHGIKATPQGEALIPYAQNILWQESLMLEKIYSLQNNSKEIIRLGVYPSWTLDWLPYLIRCFKKKHPSTEFEIRTGVLTLKRFFDDHLVDLVICEKSIIESAEWEYLMDNEMYIVINNKSPLAQETTIDLTALSSYKMVPSVITNSVVISKFKELNIPLPKITPFYSEDGSMMLSMVSQHPDYISFVSRLYESECPENVCLKPTNPLITRRIGYNILPEKRKDPLIKSFIKTLTTANLSYE